MVNRARRDFARILAGPVPVRTVHRPRTMVDGRRSTLGESADLQAIARKTDARLTSLHARFDAVTARFDQLAAAIAEQRAYLELTLARLERALVDRTPPPPEPPGSGP